MSKNKELYKRSFRTTPNVKLLRFVSVLVCRLLGLAGYRARRLILIKGFNQKDTVPDRVFLNQLKCNY